MEVSINFPCLALQFFERSIFALLFFRGYELWNTPWLPEERTADMVADGEAWKNGEGSQVKKYTQQIHPGMSHGGSPPWGFSRSDDDFWFEKN